MKYIELQKTIDNHSRLALRILDSKGLEKGSEIHINCLGVEENGKFNYQNYVRDDKYGITRFGSIATSFQRSFSNNVHKNDLEPESNDRLSSNNLSVLGGVDFYLPVEDNIMPRHFDIRYDFLSENFYIKNFRNTALFVKLDSKVVS